jgi:hypothetical protein
MSINPPATKVIRLHCPSCRIDYEAHVPADVDFGTDTFPCEFCRYPFWLAFLMAPIRLAWRLQVYAKYLWACVVHWIRKT